MSDPAGLMMAMMQPPATMEEEFQDWYDTEHFPERRDCEGFVTATRLLCLDGFPRYLALYDLESRAVMEGPGYAAIAKTRYSRWTQRIVPKMWGHYRAEADQVYPGKARLGANGVPTRLALWRFGGVEAKNVAAVVDGIKASVENTPGVLQTRVFQAYGPQAGDVIATMELAGPVALLPNPSALGKHLGNLNLTNIYMPYSALTAMQPAEALDGTLIPEGNRLRLLDALVDIAVAFAMCGQLVAVIWDVIGRTFFDAPLLWADEVGGLALTTIAFVGGALAYRRDQHIAVRVLVSALPPRARDAMHAASDWLVLETAVVCFVTSFPLLVSRWDELTPMLEMHGTWLALPLTVGMVLLAVYAVARLAAQPRGAVLSSLMVLVVLNGLALGAAVWGPAVGPALAIGLAVAVVLGTVLMGLPVGFALVLATMLFLRQVYPTAMVALPQNMVDGVSRFVLLALPFFILAGFVMEAGGISRRLVLFVAGLVGRLRGGLLQVVVVSMYIVSGISGSKAADVAAVGLVMRDMLDKEGYKRSESAAVLASAAAMGECVPPSIAMLVLGSVTSLSMGALFASGLLPAAVIALCLMALVFWRARGAQPAGPVAVVRGSLVRLGLSAILPFSMPAFLFAGILTGFATPTEISAFAVLYGLILAMLVYREVGLRGITRVAADASTVAAMVLFTLAAAQTFSWALSAAQMPQALAALVSSLKGNTTVFLLGSIVALVVLGSLLEGLPALLILAPLLLPIATRLGISDLHYGIVLLIAMGVGAFLPPLGVGFYIACAIARAPMGPSTKAMVPYVGVLLVGLLIVTFVPWFTLAVPRAIGLVQ